MRAAEILVELADRHYEILLRNVKSNGGISYYFETETGDEYEVVVGVEPHFDPTDRTVAFMLRQGEGWTDHTTGSTGTGSFKVLSTVVHCVKDALNASPEVDTLLFSARHAEATKAALYSRFANNVGRYLPGWHKIKPPAVGNDQEMQIYAVSQAQ